MLQRAIAATALLGLSGFAFAESVDINLSNDSARLSYAAPFREAEYNAAFLYNEDDDWVIDVGLLAHGIQEGSASRIKAGFGGKIFLASANKKEGLGLALGGQASYFPNRLPVGIGGSIFYAPNVVTGLDAERIRDADIRIEWEVMRTTSIYLGYRKIKMRLENGQNITVDKGGYLGMRINF